MENRYNPNYVHHQSSRILSSLKEVVFGLEDGMVSTLGAITGIAIGSQDKFTIVLAGMVIISVESVSILSSPLYIDCHYFNRVVFAGSGYY